LVSGFVALTLTPMMCSQLLKHEPQPNRFDRTMEYLLGGLTRGYTFALRWVLGGHRWLVVVAMLASAAGSVWLFMNAKNELAPLEDRGVVVSNVNAPDGSTLAYTSRYLREIERIGMDYPEFDRVFTVGGNPTVSQGIAFFRAKDWNERDKTTIQLARELQPRLAGLPGVTASPITPPSLGQGFRERPLSLSPATATTTCLVYRSNSWPRWPKIPAWFSPKPICA
jgi:multidrug efflux pump